MELEQYYHTLLSEVRQHRDDGALDREAFFDTACELLREAGAIADFSPAPFREGIGTSRFMCMDGYDFAAFEQDESIVVIACDDGITDRLSDEPDEIPTIIAKECNRYLSGMKRFVESARRGQFTKNHEESTPAYGFAQDINELDKKVSRYRLYFVTDRFYTGRSDSIAGTGEKIKSDVYSEQIEAHVWDLRRLCDAASSLTPQESLTVDFLRFSPRGVKALLSPVMNNEMRTLTMFFKGDMLADLYEKYGAKLMEANVRSFLSIRGKVNKGIRSTLKSNPEKFVAFNNGITATVTGWNLVSDSEGDGQILHISSFDDMQIVNGGQTTASLFYSRKNDGTDLSKVVVPAKVVVVSDEDVARRLIPDISRYTNSQNKVAEADFSSNSDFQVQLEHVSRQVLSPSKSGQLYQTHWYYERTRGQYESEKNRAFGTAQKRFLQNNPKSQLIKMTDTAKYYMSWAQKPFIVSLGAQKCFGVFAEETSKTMGDDVSSIDTEYYKQLVCKKILFDATRKMAMKASWYQGYPAPVATYAVAKFAYDFEKTNGKQSEVFNDIWQAQGIPEKILKYLKISGQQATKILLSEDRDQQNVTEWAKKKACWQRLQTQPSCIADESSSEEASPIPTAVGNTQQPTANTFVPKEKETEERNKSVRIGSISDIFSLPSESQTSVWSQLPRNFWGELYQFLYDHHLTSVDTAEIFVQINHNGLEKGTVDPNALSRLVRLAMKDGFNPDTYLLDNQIRPDTLGRESMPAASTDKELVSPSRNGLVGELTLAEFNGIPQENWKIAEMYDLQRGLSTPQQRLILKNLANGIPLTENSEVQNLNVLRKRMLARGFSPVLLSAKE